MYTVSFLHSNGQREVSRYFQTRHAAQKWARWLLTQKWVVRTFLYRGQEGAELLEEAGR
jgi:hypothetical protein